MNCQVEIEGIECRGPGECKKAQALFWETWDTLAELGVQLDNIEAWAEAMLENEPEPQPQTEKVKV